MSILSYLFIQDAKGIAILINDPIAAHRIVQIAREANPSLYIIVRTLNLSNVEIASFHLHPNSILVGKSLLESPLRHLYGMTVLLIRRGMQILSNPPAETELMAEDIIVVIAKHVFLKQGHFPRIYTSPVWLVIRAVRLGIIFRLFVIFFEMFFQQILGFLYEDAHHPLHPWA